MAKASLARRGGGEIDGWRVVGGWGGGVEDVQGGGFVRLGKRKREGSSLRGGVKRKETMRRGLREEKQ